MERIGNSTVWDKKLGAAGWDIETREVKKNNIIILKTDKKTNKGKIKNH